jgi:YtkA-like
VSAILSRGKGVSIRQLAVLLAVVVVGAATPAVAGAHEGGKAEPRIAAQAKGSGFNRMLIVRLTDLDSGKPIRGATVEVKTQMTSPHVMTLLPRTIPESSRPGIYRLPYTFVMPGDWKADFQVSGKKVLGAKATLDVPVAATTAGSGSQTIPNQPAPAVLPTRLEAKVTERDWVTMFMLWVHGLAAMGWIIGVVAMTIALATPSILTSGIRARISAWYRSWGAWAHWALVPLIVATGIYNMVYVTPFKLRWPWDNQLDLIAYGNWYEAILLIKLALFVVLLATGTAMLLRAVRPAPAATPALVHGSAEPSQGFVATLVGALGGAGIAYVLTVPAILAAAMALRYVHILSHVAEVVNT